jgi:hypothetical protein
MNPNVQKTVCKVTSQSQKAMQALSLISPN